MSDENKRTLHLIIQWLCFFIVMGIIIRQCLI